MWSRSTLGWNPPGKKSATSPKRCLGPMTTRDSSWASMAGSYWRASQVEAVSRSAGTTNPQCFLSAGTRSMCASCFFQWEPSPSRGTSNQAIPRPGRADRMMTEKVASRWIPSPSESAVAISLRCHLLDSDSRRSWPTSLERKFAGSKRPKTASVESKARDWTRPSPKSRDRSKDGKRITDSLLLRCASTTALALTKSRQTQSTPRKRRLASDSTLTK